MLLQAQWTGQSILGVQPLIGSKSNHVNLPPLPGSGLNPNPHWDLHLDPSPRYSLTLGEKLNTIINTH